MDEHIFNTDEERPKCVHLFNCDKTYNLDAVEKLLLDIKDDIKRKLNFDIKLPIGKNDFRLSKMSEMSETTIPKLQMDFAVFVVHAHESRLSINEDNAGIGYAKIYKALLRATAEKVLIIIGGDDNYKNKDEEESSVISRWARRKVSSQFQQEYLDGRKSFIFSWNKKHREIHEEALLHYFDPNKKGQKFEYQPKDRPTVPPARKQESEAEIKATEGASNKQEEKELTKNTKSAENPSKIDVNTKKAPKSLGAKSKEEDDLETIDNIEGNFVVLEIPVIAGQSGQSEQENDQETETTWELINLDHDDNYCIDQDEAVICQQPQVSSSTKDGTLVMKLRMRNGSISFNEKDAVWNEKWRPPDGLLAELSEKWVTVAEAELEIYHVEEKGAIRVEIKDTSKNSLFPAMVVNVFNEVFRYCFTGEMSPDQKQIEWPDSD